ncbi:MAG: hypothetical protein ABI665_03880 [Vicinamibacterales bacterium]
MTVAVKTTVEILRFEPETWRAGAALDALMRTSDAVEARKTHRYEGGADWLLLWGPGAPNRWPIMEAQIAAGGRVIVLDLAYWSRHDKIRVSIDTAHPQALVMKQDWPARRLVADGVRVADKWNPNGPIIVAGLGRKARAQYGDQVLDWEIGMVRACEARWPTRRVLYRRKQFDAPIPPGVTLAGMGPIDDLLVGSSLVITWHSNVAVDAIRMGIPAVCRDGAAAAVCPSELPVEPELLPVQTRDRFLANLAWFQWNPATESKAMWTWLQELLA